MFKKWWKLILLIIILIALIGVIIKVMQSHQQKKISKSLDTILKEPQPEIADLDSIREEFKQQKYELVVSSAKKVYDKDSNPLAFRLAALGYCVRALQKLGKDTASCQNKASQLMTGTENPYKQYLQDSFDDKKVVTE